MMRETEGQTRLVTPAPDFFARPRQVRFKAQRDFLRRFSKQPLGIAGFITLTILLVIAAVGPSLTSTDPYQIGGTRLAGPSREYLAGTDHLGRDVFARVIYGVRPSMVVALGAVVLGVTAGSLIGSISAYLGGKADLLIQRVMDAVDSLPSLFLGVLVLTVLSPSYLNLIIAIGIVSTPGAQRIVRAATLAEKERDYISAGRVIGATDGRILFRHILPNIVSPILVIASADLGSAILIAASLSFLGFGTPPPEPSLGAMVGGEGRRYMEQAPWLVIAPATVISIAVLSANFLGDALRDVLDPRLRM